MEQTPRQSPYAPANANPLRLASATIQAVDRIGVAACDEIEHTADEIIRGANDVADNLRTLAFAIREHSKIAGEHVTEFCSKATSVIEGVRDIQAKLLAGEREAEAKETEANPEAIRTGPVNRDPSPFDERAAHAKEVEDDKFPLPEAIRRGPANGHDGELSPRQTARRRG